MCQAIAEAANRDLNLYLDTAALKKSEILIINESMLCEISAFSLRIYILIVNQEYIKIFV